MNAVQTRLLRAIYATLRPISRLLIRSGITYSQFAEISKIAFVMEANRERDTSGRLVNASRIAVKTGISRKEIRRIRDLRQGSGQTDVLVDSGAVCAQLLHLWYTDSKYVDPSGQPRRLAIIEPPPSFSQLVRSVAGDVPLGAVKAELKEAGAVEELSDGTLQALKPYYVPRNFDEKALRAIADSLFTLAATAEHNANPDRTTEGFLQRFAYSTSLPSQSVELFRRWARVQATDFVESMDRWLGTHEPSEPDDAEKLSNQIAGIGVYYYEGVTAEGLIADDPVP